MKTIDMTPTWSEIGSIFYRFAVSGETAAVRAAHSEYVRAFAMATMLNELMPELTDEQCERIHAGIAAELKRQGLKDGK